MTAQSIVEELFIGQSNATVCFVGIALFKGSSLFASFEIKCIFSNRTHFIWLIFKSFNFKPQKLYVIFLILAFIIQLNILPCGLGFIEITIVMNQLFVECLCPLHPLKRSIVPLNLIVRELWMQSKRTLSLRLLWCHYRKYPLKHKIPTNDWLFRNVIRHSLILIEKKIVGCQYCWWVIVHATRCVLWKKALDVRNAQRFSQYLYIIRFIHKIVNWSFYIYVCIYTNKNTKCS